MASGGITPLSTSVTSSSSLSPSTTAVALAAAVTASRAATMRDPRSPAALAVSALLGACASASETAATAGPTAETDPRVGEPAGSDARRRQARRLGARPPCRDRSAEGEATSELAAEAWRSAKPGAAVAGSDVLGGARDGGGEPAAAADSKLMRRRLGADSSASDGQFRRASAGRGFMALPGAARDSKPVALLCRGVAGAEVAPPAWTAAAGERHPASGAARGGGASGSETRSAAAAVGAASGTAGRLRRERPTHGADGGRVGVTACRAFRAVVLSSSAAAAAWARRAASMTSALGSLVADPGGVNPASS